MAQLIVIYWRDIPAQVVAERGRGRKREQAKIELPERFAHAIDAAAMRGEAKDAGDYLEEWRRADPVECGEDLPVEAQQVAAQLVTDYPNERLKELIASGGHAAAPA